MSEFSQSFVQAFALIGAGDTQLWAIVMLSLRVTLTAVTIATLIAVPIGAALALFRFWGRGAIVLTLTTAMGFPPVVVGLVLYLMFSQSGPLAPLELLYTPTAMIIAQIILVFPIIAILTRTAVIEANLEFDELLTSMRASRWQRITTLISECQASITTAVLAGFGRAMAEVGAVMIVGGNINYVTRVMTTSIALETSRGELEMALALGIILLAMTLIISVSIIGLRNRMSDVSYA